ncbi:uncharacterized protein TNCV_3550311 [Trichonephila clavipes]|nr:uncharacterized protein TNCV_3550311 [Trichonephila clavipes]
MGIVVDCIVNPYHSPSLPDGSYRDCGLLYRSIAARVGRDPMTVGRKWNRRVQDGNTERHAGSQRPPITSSREDRHLTRMALMDRAATSRALSQELVSFARQQMFARTVRQHESRFCLQHQDGRIHVCRQRGERTLAARISLHHTSPSPGVMVWGPIGFTSQSPLVRIDGTLNSVRYISGVLRAVALPFIRAQRNLAFQQDNIRAHVAGIVRTFLDTENVWLFSLPARSPDLTNRKHLVHGYRATGSSSPYG